jgi:predicted Zn-dependent peptidase
MKIIKIPTDKFKTNLCAIFLTLPLKRETITYNALIPAILRRGTANLTNQLEINKKLENMYGASFNCGIDKTADYCVLKFYIETLDDQFLIEDNKLTEEAIKLLIDIVFNPLVKDNGFDEEYVEQEKENLKKVINSRKDDKSMYATNRCIEEMFKNQPFGIYKYGYEEDFSKINAQNLYAYYKEIIKSAKINFFMAGKINEINDKEIENNILKMTGNVENIEIPSYEIEKRLNEQIIKESMDVSQGKLIIGLDAPAENKYTMAMYSMILGGGANSKLFQNVREKAGLAYSAGTLYMKMKDAILIRAGIEIANFDKAVKIIKEQINDMKDGKITDDEFNSAMQLRTSLIRLIPESQQDIISYYFDQELNNENISIDEYIQEIKKVKKEDIIEIAKQVKINTIYFLQN